MYEASFLMIFYRNGCIIIIKLGLNRELIKMSNADVMDMGGDRMPVSVNRDEKRITWQEMVDKYPDMWVAVKDAEMDGPDILSGVLVDVKSDDDIAQYRINNKKKGYIFSRTTEGVFNGITGSSVVISVD